MTNPNAVYNVQAVSEILNSYKNKRIDIALASDSNARFGADTGHLQGMQVAVSESFGPLYSTGVLPANSNNLSWGGRINGIDAFGGIDANVTPPSFINDISLDSGLGIADWMDQPEAYLDNTAFVSNTTTNNGNLSYVEQWNPVEIKTDLDPNNLWDIASHMVFHAKLATFASGTDSQYRVGMRQGTSTTMLAEDATQNSVTGADGFIDYALDVPAGDRGHDQVRFQFNKYGGAPLKGPFSASYVSVEWPEITTGVSCSLAMYQGSLSAYDACRALKATPIAGVSAYLKQLVRLQEGKRQLIFQIIHGGNDTLEATGSWNRDTEAFDSDKSFTALGFANNIEGMRKYITDAWVNLGYGEDNIRFICGPYHPQGGDQTIDGVTQSRVQWNEDYYNELIGRGWENTCVIKGTELVTPAEMVAGGEYAGGGASSAHLDMIGYENHARRGMTSLKVAAASVSTSASHFGSVMIFS